METYPLDMVPTFNYSFIFLFMDLVCFFKGSFILEIIHDALFGVLHVKIYCLVFFWEKAIALC